MTTWTTEPRQWHQTRHLTVDDPRAPTPPDFAGALWPPQATLLAAMLDLEARPALAVRGFARRELGLYTTRAGRLAAKFSSGKTAVCIALVCASPVPRQTPEPLGHVCRTAERREGWGLRSERGLGPQGGYPSLEVRYPRLVPSTLVIASAAVLSQWEQNLARFAPHLTVCVIDGVRPLRAYAARFAAGATGYDVVLLKGGQVTARFAVPGEAGYPAAGSRRLVGALAAVTSGCSWARVVVDDFDTIALTRADEFLPSMFTWVISATDREARLDLPPRAAAATPAEYLRLNRGVPLLEAGHNHALRGLLRLRCEDAYTRDHIPTTTIRYRRVVVEGGAGLEMLANLGVDAEVLEMAAAGAFETAAAAMNIQVATIGELIERVLAARVDKYRKAVRALARVAAARAAAAAAAGPENTPPEVSAIRAALKDGDAAAARAALARLGASGPPFVAAMRTLRQWAEKERDEHGPFLNRMRENVLENCCQACTVPIEAAAYVVNCCQVVICDGCAIRDPARGTFIKRCPNCARDVDPRRNLIYVGEGLDLAEALTDEALLVGDVGDVDDVEAGDDDGDDAEAGDDDVEAGDDDVDDDVDDAEAGDDVVEAGEAGDDDVDDAEAGDDAFAPWADNPRLRALLQIVAGVAPTAIRDREVAPFVDGLIVGAAAVPKPAGAPHKALVFAMHPESARHIIAALRAFGVDAERLMGTRRKKDGLVGRFRAPAGAPGALNVLVATSSRDCAGLHLPETTLLIMYHHHQDKAVAEQAVARAQRVGRTCSLEVLEILNEGEAQNLAA